MAWLMFLKVPVTLLGMTNRTPAEVGAMIKARRLELKMTPGDLVTAAKIDIKTLQRIEDGSRVPQARTRLKLDMALKWSAGSVDAILTGGEPTENQLATHLRTSDDSRPAIGEGHVLHVIERLLDREDFPEEDREQLRLELEEMKIERFPALFDALSRASKVRIVKFGEQLKTEEHLLEENHDAVPSDQTPQPDASSEADEIEEDDPSGGAQAPTFRWRRDEDRGAGENRADE